MVPTGVADSLGTSLSRPFSFDLCDDGDDAYSACVCVPKKKTVLVFNVKYICHNCCYLFYCQRWVDLHCWLLFISLCSSGYCRFTYSYFHHALSSAWLVLQQCRARTYIRSFTTQHTHRMVIGPVCLVQMRIKLRSSCRGVDIICWFWFTILTAFAHPHILDFFSACARFAFRFILCVRRDIVWISRTNCMWRAAF